MFIHWIVFRFLFIFPLEELHVAVINPAGLCLYTVYYLHFGCPGTGLFVSCLLGVYVCLHVYRTSLPACWHFRGKLIFYCLLTLLPSLGLRHRAYYLQSRNLARWLDLLCCCCSKAILTSWASEKASSLLGQVLLARIPKAKPMRVSQEYQLHHHLQS